MDLPIEIPGHLVVETLTATQSMNVPDGEIDDDAIKTAANIGAGKLTHRYPLNYAQADGADVVTETQILGIMYKAGSLVAVRVVPTTAPDTSAGKQYTVDIQKSTAAGAFATVLSSVVTVDDSSTDLTVQAAVLSGSNTHIAGDVYRAVITASGSSGNQGQGLGVTAIIEENGT